MADTEIPMIERMAKSLGDSGGNGITLRMAMNEKGTPEGTEYTLRYACRVVLAAMREPTKAMVEVGLGYAGADNENYPMDPTDGWRAMIDAALAEEG